MNRQTVFRGRSARNQGAAQRGARQVALLIAVITRLFVGNNRSAVTISGINPLMASPDNTSSRNRDCKNERLWLVVGGDGE